MRCHLHYPIQSNPPHTFIDIARRWFWRIYCNMDLLVHSYERWWRSEYLLIWKGRIVDDAIRWTNEWRWTTANEGCDMKMSSCSLSDCFQIDNCGHLLSLFHDGYVECKPFSPCSGKMKRPHWYHHLTPLGSVHGKNHSCGPSSQPYLFVRSSLFPVLLIVTKKCDPMFINR